MDNKKVNEVYDLLKKTGYVESINISREMDADSTKDYNLILVISTCPFCEGDIKMRLTFYKVQEFKLGNINNFYKIFLEIIDVTDRHLEEIRYYVDEIEYNMISFACVDFKYELL